MNEAVAALVAEARATNERRALVVHGARERCYAAARRALEAAGIEGTETTCVTTGDIGPAEHLPPRASGDLLGRTREAVVVDSHDETRPNALGRAVGAVDGGGLLVVLAPPLDAWPDRRDDFDDRLAVPPFDRDGVTGRFRRRLVRTLREHRGVAIYDADAETWEDDGLTDPAPRLAAGAPALPDPEDRAFPRAAYEACLTGDQLDAVCALERLRDPGAAVVVEADRGRGKSAAAGLAAGALAAEGRDVLVTAPRYRNAAEVFDRAAALLRDLDALDSRPDDTHPVRATEGGRVRYATPPAAVTEAADAVVVDEAAAVPVRVLERLADGGTPVAFATTVHGYEGAGRGFDVRFRDRLAEGDRTVTEASLAEPIRYAAGDPVEVWAFRALLLDASPPVPELVADATPDTVRYEAFGPDALVADPHLLRGAFGLLVAAHYRTEPDDLARLLDAPNITVRALTHDGRVVAVALLAWEGGLPESVREAMYDGETVRGNMLPDVLTAQLRDREAGAPRGLRVVRIAVHDAVRSRGLGSALLDAVAAEFGPDGEPAPWRDGETPDPLTARHEATGEPFDYLGVGFGATPRLLRFWRRAGYRTVHLSTTRNDASGEHSALMVRPFTDAGEALLARNGAWFRRQIPALLSDALRDCDPGVVVGALRATEGEFALDLDDREWRAVAAAAYGSGYFGSAPRPFRRLVARGVADGVVDGGTAQLLVARALQARPFAALADEFGYVSERACVKGFVAALDPLVEAYGGEAAREEAARYR
ncbi:tRNA(Met) cytidine acetyltransferase TmcA [Halosegnis marinus]|uniref:tRNA(Met) cytidine acetyltransferase TmcA n=1 Tax=Halosegnis marinus TaxID=3034023 RepID=A0ABD5ZSP3_9EURY|nr:tRNA(Met) cytidine acetyltransferase TmcA [Halosegnis sp. DT85]